MKTIENVTIYKCEHCNKKLERKHAMIRHEEFCNNNPKNVAACLACAFCEETRVSYPVETDEGYSSEKTSKAFKCTKLNKMLYPMKVVKKGLLEKYPDTFKGQEPMPTECEHWNYTK